MITQKKSNERWQALHILHKVWVDHIPLGHLLTPDLTSLTKDLCFGVCRHFYRLEAIADALVAKRPKDEWVWLNILLGLYQLHYLRIPDYAVVKETVNLLERTNKNWAKGLVNAVLRNFCRQSNDLLHNLETDIRFTYGHPTWLVKRIKQDWPAHWAHILNANDQHPPMHLRVNQRQHTRVEYLALLHAAGISATGSPYAEHAITLSQPCAVDSLPKFRDGAVSVQDIAAQLATPLLDLHPGLRVLDACCAPGGKTCHIAESEPKLAKLVALDIDSKRLKRVQENLQRLHLSADIQVGDALTPTEWWDGQLFDRILLDAPCSATGVIRRHPDIKLLRTAKEIAQITQLQSQLLRTLWPLLAPGGLLVYATCSIMPCENSEQIAAFIQNTPDCQVQKIETEWGHSTDFGRQILPGERNMDGFFYSLLCKN